MINTNTDEKSTKDSESEMKVKELSEKLQYENNRMQQLQTIVHEKEAKIKDLESKLESASLQVLDKFLLVQLFYPL